ncbi:MAG: PAS domain-containing protein [Gammaproteobacteria bacterium]|nr:PAS domain-containing protein [Gammaproteobacteria bacterium]
MQRNTFQYQILDYLNTAVLVTDTDCKVLFVNPAAEELLGFSLRKAHQFRLQDILVDGGPTTLHDCLQRKQAEGQTYTYREICLKPPGTEEHVVNFTITPRFDGHVSGGLLVEFSRADRILKIASEEQLMAQHLTAREIARGMAHEINNPLGGLRGAAQLLERELPEKSKEYTQIIINEADRLQKLVKSMLGPRAQPNKSEVNIHEILDHVIKLIQSDNRDKSKIEVDFDPSIPTFAADRGQLIQAVLNIVRNAWQAVENRGRIFLKTRVHRSYTIGHSYHRLVLQIDVVDDGPGIPKDKIKQIFYPMITGRSEGTGLGLTIAQSLINLHGGLIECESAPGETVFSILLPLEPAKEEDK